MSYRTGIIAAEDGKTINDEPLAYRSDLGHLKIDTRDGSNHLRLFDIKPSVPARNLNAATDALFDDEFFSIEHNLPFIPKASVFMLLRDAPATMATMLGRYYGGNIYVQQATFATETIFMRVDAKSIHLIRRAQSYNIGFPATNRTTLVQDTLLRVKYMIFSNEASSSPYDTTLPFI